MLKKSLMIYGLAIALVTGTSLALAGEGGKGRHGNPEQRLQRMQEHLNLSDDQVSQIRALGDSGLSHAERREQMQGILTEDQRSQLEEHRARRREQGHRYRGGREEEQIN